MYAVSTKEELIKFSSFIIIFFTAINVLEDRNQFKRVIFCIIFWGFILAFYGLVKKYAFAQKAVTYSYSFSTFGNKNHYAAYMIMATTLATGYTLLQRDRIKKYLLGFVTAIMSVSVFLSLSRAGSLSLIFSFTLFTFLLRRERMIKEKYWTIGIVAVLATILVLIAGTGPIEKRFFYLWQDRYVQAIRWFMVKDSVKMVRDFPLFGVGWGNFQYIFTLYRKIIYNRYVVHLHNDHLQLIIETGLIASFFYFSFLFKIFKDILTKLKTRKDPLVKSLAMGGICGLLGVMLHSIVDFNFHIPAIAILFWLILGLTYKLVNTHFIDDRKII